MKWYFWVLIILAVVTATVALTQTEWFKVQWDKMTNGTGENGGVVPPPTQYMRRN